MLEKKAYSRPQNMGYGDLIPLNGAWQQRTPKRTSLRGSTSYEVSLYIVKIGLRAMAQRDLKHRERKKKRSTKTCDMSCVRRDHTRCCIATWICMCGHTRDLVIYSGFR